MTETWPFEAAVREVVELLARQDYAAVERLSGGVRLTAGEMAGAVAAYGRRLVVPPPGAAPIEVCALSDGSGWSIDVPMWTTEEGRSDLTLQLTLRPAPGAGYRIEVDDIHVL